MWRNFLEAFVPIFVAVDAVGVLPVFVSLTQGMTEPERKKTILQSMLTAVSLALIFILLGKAIFKFLGITVNDFMIAGGVILFCLSVVDLLKPGKHRRAPVEDIGAVPIGTPLIVGPAVLTTILLTLDQYGFVITLSAVLTNILLAGFVFLHSGRLINVLGNSGSRALSKIMALLLAAIAVKMIRKGLVGFL
jgi:multiple antibiotic resistance protein